MERGRRWEELELPWGSGTTPDGGRVWLFNRLRQPLYVKYSTTGTVFKCSGCETTLWAKEHEYFYNESNPPWENAATLERCIKILDEWGVVPPPGLTARLS